jgi:hypothetical protein
MHWWELSLLLVLGHLVGMPLDAQLLDLPDAGAPVGPEHQTEDSGASPSLQGQT